MRIGEPFNVRIMTEITHSDSFPALYMRISYSIYIYMIFILQDISRDYFCLRWYSAYFIEDDKVPQNLASLVGCLVLRFNILSRTYSPCYDSFQNENALIDSETPL